MAGGFVFENLALDPGKKITQYTQDLWTERDGLPHGTIQALAQTQDGYLWVGTGDGLARFDGVKFTVFQAGRENGLKSNNIRALYEDSAGNLWIGTFNGGVSRYARGRFEHFSMEDGLPSSGVLEIFEDNQKRVWLGTWNGVAFWQEGRFCSFNAADGLAGRNGWSIAQDAQGSIWVATERGLNLFEGPGFHLRHPRVLPSEALRKIYTDREGTMWVAGLDGGVSRLANSQWEVFTKNQGLADDHVRTLLEDRDGNIWAGTWGGLSRLRDGRICNYSEENGWLHGMVETLLEDREGSLWIGTRGSGLVRLRDGKFRPFTTREGLPHDYVKCVRQTRDGGIWIGTSGGGLGRLQAGAFEQFTPKQGLPSYFVAALEEDDAGCLWAGTARPPALVKIHPDSRVEVFDESNGLPIVNVIRVIHADRKGRLWIGGDGGGLCRFDGETFVSWGVADGLPSALIRVIREDSRGHLWVGTNDGLCRLREGKFEVFTTLDGLAHNAVYAIHEDDAGTLWFGTQEGLSRWRDGKFTSYTTEQGLHHDLIFQILEDDAENLWMSSNRGVFQISKKQIALYDSGRAERLFCFPYSITDGMKSSQCEGGSQPAGWRAVDGSFWFATIRGLAVINPRDLPLNPHPPRVLMEKVLARGELLNPSGELRLPPGTGEFEFHYTALSFLVPEKIFFKYKLAGLDSQWIEAGPRRTAFYNKLPPGKYEFLVTACNEEGIWNEAPAVFAFQLEPFFYQRAWFYLPWGVALALAGWGYHRRRMRVARREFGVILAERTRIARDLHDTLAQAFAGIAFQLEAVSARLKKSPDQAEPHLNIALGMVRHCLSEARRSVMNLRSSALERGGLAQALEDSARQVTADKPIHLELNVSGNCQCLPASIENHLLRMGQEALANAIQHAAPSRICIRLECRAQTVLMEIEDDGSGFQPAPNASQGAHFGLLGMQERARQLGGSLQIEGRPGHGTLLHIEVPFKQPENQEP